MSFGWGWKPYVSVGERREQARRHISKRQKQGLVVQPVKVEGRNIARTFWGMSWCKHLESFSDYINRLPRGRTYVRNGSVCHLEISSGQIKAIVSGSELYDIKIAVRKLTEDKWTAVKQRCSGKIGSLIELLQGKLSNSVMQVVTDHREGLFPVPSEIKMNCSCPDWATMCKHVAATLYGVGARLDEKPELLFVLRGVDHEELVDADATAFATTGTQPSSRRVSQGDLQDIFGIELLDEQASGSSRPSATTKGAAAKQTQRRSAGNVNNPTRKNLGPSSQSAAVNEQSVTGKTVRELRTRLAMSQTELASLVGVSAASVGKWEKEKGRLNLQPRSRTALLKVLTLTKRQAWRQLKEC